MGKSEIRATSAARGKAERSHVPLAAHADVHRLPTSPNPLELLQQQAESRVPDLVPIRYGRMMASPFAFYRGAALVMASDLAAGPTTSLTTQLCGDAHASNFGLFASPERHLVFDLNDFDETLPGPFDWDVKRLAASIEIAGRDNGFTRKERRTAVLAAASSYRTAMRDFAAMSSLDVWYSHLNVDREFDEILRLLPPARVKYWRAALDKARSRDSRQALTRLTTVEDGRRRIISDPPLVVPVNQLFPEETASEITSRMHRMIAAYESTLPSDRRTLLRRYRFVEMARKVVGVGSVGTRAWILLFEGMDESDPLFLQAKEAQPSVLERFLPESQYDHHGKRVVKGQQLMQAASDVFLGWVTSIGVDGINRDNYVRQLRDWKGSLDPSTMVPRGLTIYGAVCGWVLARAHARSGDRVAIASYLGGKATFDDAIADFAAGYADITESDYAQMVRAVSDGTITAIPGV